MDEERCCCECNYYMECPCCDQDICTKKQEHIVDTDITCDSYNDAWRSE